MAQWATSARDAISCRTCRLPAAPENSRPSVLRFWERADNGSGATASNVRVGPISDAQLLQAAQGVLCGHRGRYGPVAACYCGCGWMGAANQSCERPCGGGCRHGDGQGTLAGPSTSLSLPSLLTVHHCTPVQPRSRPAPLFSLAGLANALPTGTTCIRADPTGLLTRHPSRCQCQCSSSPTAYCSSPFRPVLAS